MDRKIDVSVGIYNTEYTLVNHHDGSVSIKTPYVKWAGNSGSLAFKVVKINKFVQQAKDCFADYDTAEMSIGEIISINDQI